MNELQTAIIATLRAEAEGAAMTTDTTRENHKLDHRLDDLDRRHRRWTVGVAIAATFVVVAAATGVVVGLRASRSTGDGQPVTTTSAGPSQPPMHIATSTLSPNVSVDLPYWTAFAHHDSWAKDSIRYTQSLDCPACATGQDRNLMLLTPTFSYAPSDHTNMVRNPTFAQYVAAWDSLQSVGMGVIRDRHATTVDGRSAVLMTVDFTDSADGLAACPTDISAPADCWTTAAGRTARVAIIDGGATGPLVVYEAVNTSNPDKADLTAEVDTVLSTLTIG